MNIRIDLPSGKVTEGILIYLKKNLVAFHNRDQEVSGAEVRFKEMDYLACPGRSCDIELIIYGESLFVHREAESFEQAARQAIRDLSKRVDELIREHQDPPLQMTSTVKV